MQPPPSSTIIGKLKKLRAEINGFKISGYTAHSSPEFGNWQSSVDRWLRAGATATEYEQSDFIRLRFTPNGSFDETPPNEAWNYGLARSDHILQAAIENIEHDWSQAAVSKPQPIWHGAPVTINNTNLQVDVSVQAVLEAVAREVAATDPDEGKGWTERIKRLLENPLFKTILTEGVDIFMKHRGG
jgi:hypothetical protein